MKIFISHPIKDEKLALELKSVLEESDEIEVAHIAQKEKDFEIEISEKIIKQINTSDYLVALITSNSKTSASVNQELGYSQGVKCPKIPLIEESAKKGCLIYGKDTVDFTRTNFSEKCKEVLEYILVHPKKNSNNSLKNPSLSPSQITSSQKQLVKEIPSALKSFRRLVVIPSNQFTSKSFSNEVIDFVKQGPKIFQTVNQVLRQNEIHLVGSKPEREHKRYGIINEKGQIVLQEMLHYDKIVEVGRELVYLLSALIFAKDFYKNIGYDGTLSIRYLHEGVQNFQFGASPDTYNDAFDFSFTVQKSHVEIIRDVNFDFNVVEVINSIMVEFGRACDWTPNERSFVPHLNSMLKKYFPEKL